MQYSGFATILQGVLLCLLLDGCATSVRAPVVSPGDSRQKPVTEPAKQKPRQTIDPRSDFYIVRKGDTLYSIAWNYGHDYRQVAAWNNISQPYVIYPGQRVVLNAPAAPAAPAVPAPRRKKARALTPGPIITRDSKIPAAAESEQERKVVKAPPQAKPPAAQRVKLPTDGPVQWFWPVKGQLVKSDTPISRKGVDIGGRLGQDINAAGTGEVVYSGSGLLGYGRLIIIKHNDVYLSAYAHNKELLVSEGDYVKAGQNIAQMGQTSNGRTLLHFEIRKNGKPVDPLDYLPKL